MMIIYLFLSVCSKFTIIIFSLVASCMYYSLMYMVHPDLRFVFQTGAALLTCIFRACLLYIHIYNQHKKKRPDQAFLTEELPPYIPLGTRPTRVTRRHGKKKKKVLRKQLSDTSGPTVYEDLSSLIRPGMITLGYDLVDPLGIALDLREAKVGNQTTFFIYFFFFFISFFWSSGRFFSALFVLWG